MRRKQPGWRDFVPGALSTKQPTNAAAQGQSRKIAQETNPGSTSTGVAFDRLCAVTGFPTPTAEHRFAPPRRWRFDWAFVSQRVALEVEGGVFRKSRHTSGTGFRNDLEKYNEATAQGWRVLRVLPEQLESTTTFDWLRRTLAQATEAAQ